MQLEIFAFQTNLLEWKKDCDFSTGSKWLPSRAAAYQRWHKGVDGVVLASMCFELAYPTPPAFYLKVQCNKPSFPGLLLRILSWVTNIQCFPDSRKCLDQLTDGVVGTTSAMLLLLILGDKGTCPFKEISGGEYHPSQI